MTDVPTAGVGSEVARGKRIDACQWHVDAEAPPFKQRALDHFRARYSVLLKFMAAEGLLRDPLIGTNVADWMAFDLREGDLTPEGLELVRRCHGRWRCAFGQGHRQKQLIQWKRRLAELRAEAGHAAGQRQ